MVDDKKLKGKIVECGFTQKTLAPMLGLTAYTLGKKISNKAMFNIDEVERICAILGINDPLSYFFTDWLHKRENSALQKGG